MAIAATRADDGSFKIAGADLTPEFHCRRRVILNLGGVYVVSTVWKSSYASPDTTVYLDEEVVTSALTQVEFGIGVDPTHQFPNHNHSNVEGDGSHREQRMEMEWADSDTIKIHPGAYLLYSSDGKINRMMYNDTELTFNFGSGGSNSASTDLNADDIHYLSLDESVCKAQRSRKLTAGCFINHTAEPSKNNAKMQWLNGNDRNIWAINTNDSSQVREFVQSGRKVTYLDRVMGMGYWDAQGMNMGTTWTTVAFDFPVFVREIYSTLFAYVSGASCSYNTRPKTSNGLGTILGYQVSGDTANAIALISIDSNQEAEFKSDNAAATLWGCTDTFLLGIWQ